MGWRLLLTRAEADNQSLALLLAARQIQCFSLPLLQIEPLPETALQRSQ
jgi:uroporphyrinogen-III synthase